MQISQNAQYTKFTIDGVEADVSADHRDHLAATVIGFAVQHVSGNFSALKHQEFTAREGKFRLAQDDQGKIAVSLQRKGEKCIAGSETVAIETLAVMVDVAAARAALDYIAQLQGA